MLFTAFVKANANETFFSPFRVSQHENKESNSHKVNSMLDLVSFFLSGQVKQWKKMMHIWWVRNKGHMTRFCVLILFSVGKRNTKNFFMHFSTKVPKKKFLCLTGNASKKKYLAFKKWFFLTLNFLLHFPLKNNSRVQKECIIKRAQDAFVCIHLFASRIIVVVGKECSTNHSRIKQ